MTKKIENYTEDIIDMEDTEDMEDMEDVEDMEDQFKNAWYQLKYFLYNTHK